MRSVSFITGSVGSEIVKKDAKVMEMHTDWGKTTLYLKDGTYFLPRHSLSGNIPPHNINHRANITALKDVGVTGIVGLYSVGSLNLAFGPGTIIIPQDYLNLGNVLSLFEHECKHITPSLITPFRENVIRSLREADISLKGRGVYIQSQGARLETMAEIALYRPIGDIIGMTMANEATLAQEAEIPFCPICFVDNYCHGVLSEQLSMDAIRREVRSKKGLVGKMMNMLKMANL